MVFPSLALQWDILVYSSPWREKPGQGVWERLNNGIFPSSLLQGILLRIIPPRHRAHSVKNIKAGLSVLPPAALIKGFFSIPGCFQASRSPSLSASDGHAALPHHAPPTNCRHKQQAGKDAPALPTISLCCRFPSSCGCSRLDFAPGRAHSSCRLCSSCQRVQLSTLLPG